MFLSQRWQPYRHCLFEPAVKKYPGNRRVKSGICWFKATKFAPLSPQAWAKTFWIFPASRTIVHCVRKPRLLALISQSIASGYS